MVSESKFVKRTFFKEMEEGSSIRLAKSSSAVNIVVAQRGLGKPKIPEEIAGMETDSQSSLQAQIKVCLMHEERRPTSSLLLYIIIESPLLYI